uniref:Uncharacterized protein n=1 Tax=Panagrolaimus sp. ES5 TaxID=591445 RepID=A0AC34F5W3_9BILA
MKDCVTKNNSSDSSCKTAQLPDYVQCKRRSSQKSRQKKDEFIAKVKNQPIPIQKSMIAAEIAKLEKQCSRLTSTNAQHFITKKKLEKRAEFLMNFISKLHSPSAKTAQLPPEYFEIPTPTTAISPIIDRMEERIDEIKLQLKSKEITMEDLELIKEKLEIEQKILKRFEKEVEEMGKEVKELEERIAKNLEVKNQLIKMIADCEAEHLNIKNDFELCKPKVKNFDIVFISQNSTSITMCPVDFSKGIYDILF